MFEQLRPIEHAKIECGHKHFEALGQDVKFKEIDDYGEFLAETY